MAGAVKGDKVTGTLLLQYKLGDFSAVAVRALQKNVLSRLLS